MCRVPLSTLEEPQVLLTAGVVAPAVAFVGMLSSWEVSVNGRVWEGATINVIFNIYGVLVWSIIIGIILLMTYDCLTYSPPPPQTVDYVERRIIEMTNEARVAHGLTPLQHDPALAAIARAHSESMHVHGYGHVLLGQDATDRARAANYPCYGLAENIYQYPAKDPEALAVDLVDGWMASFGHRANILHPELYKIGVGVAFSTEWMGDVYATQNFSPCR